MPEFNAVENTLFIPMLGRIYASEHFQNILYDEKALSLKDVLPKGLAETGSQSQYTLLASASRSANMDRYIRDFLRRKPDGVIAELGCGLETTFYRNDDGHTHWYAVDLPDVMEYRKTLLPEPERQAYFAGDAFSDGWIRQIRIDAPDAPVLVTAGGLFHYFEEEKVLALLRMLQSFGNMELVFDSVNKRGMDFIEYGDWDNPAVYHLPKHIAGADTLQLIDVAYQNNFCPWLNTAKKLAGKPHIYH